MRPFLFAAALAAAFGAAVVAASPRNARTQNLDPFVGFQSMLCADGICVIYYPRRLEPMAREVEGIIEVSARGIARELGLDTIRQMRVYIAPDNESFRYLHDYRLPDWGAAFSELNSQLLGINAALAARSPRPLKFVVCHELSHLLLAQRVEGVRVPRWFLEGLALLQSHEWDLSDTWELMNLSARKKLPDLDDLASVFPRQRDDATLAYGESYVAVDELFRGRPEALSTLTSFIRDRRDFDAAFETTFGRTPAQFGAVVSGIMYRKYKVPGTIVNAGPLWLAFALFFIAVYVAKLAQTRRKVEAWERRDHHPPTLLP
jgi:hypothetical protein